MNKWFTQAYKQAPWRSQVKIIMIFLVALVGVILISAVYLTISGRAASAGLEVKDLEIEREVLREEIANLNTRLASVTTSAVMQRRAEKLGYERVSPENIEYIAVDGFQPRTLPMLASLPNAQADALPVIKTDYTQSLWEFLYQGMLNLRPSTRGGQK